MAEPDIGTTGGSRAMHRLVREWVDAEARAAEARRKADEAHGLALGTPAPDTLRPAEASDIAPGTVVWCSDGSDGKVPVLVAGRTSHSGPDIVFDASDGSMRSLDDAWVEAARTGPFAERKHPPIGFGDLSGTSNHRYKARHSVHNVLAYGVVDEDPRYVADETIPVHGLRGSGMANLDSWRIARPDAKFLPVDNLDEDNLRACMRWATGTGLADGNGVPAGIQPTGSRRTREWLEGLTEAVIVAWAEACGYDGWCRDVGDDEEELEFHLFTTKLPEWHILPPGSRYGSIPETMYLIRGGHLTMEASRVATSRRINVADVTGEVHDHDVSGIGDVTAEEAVKHGVDPILAWNGLHHWTDAAKLGFPVSLKPSR